LEHQRKGCDVIDDAHIRRLVLMAHPDILPSTLEIDMTNYDATCSWRLRGDGGRIDTGNVVAIQRTETEMASEIAADIAKLRCGRIIEDTTIPQEPRVLQDLTKAPSPYEGKRGKHPNNCTCSKHANAAV